MKITVATNGYLVEDDYGNLFIARTLQEAGRLAGEAVEFPSGMFAMYSSDCNSASLAEVRNLAALGKKISAIKMLRKCYNPNLGLREAKDLVEHMFGL